MYRREQGCGECLEALKGVAGEIGGGEGQAKAA